jgi:hypothetical protein
MYGKRCNHILRKEPAFMGQAELTALLALWYLGMILVPGNNHDPIAKVSLFKSRLHDTMHGRILGIRKSRQALYASYSYVAHGQSSHRRASMI